MDLGDIDRIASTLRGVSTRTRGGLVEWRFKGRLVARQLDETQIVIRTGFAPRDRLIARHPGTFQVPARYRRHMMVVADLSTGDEGAVEDAVMAAWALQAGHG